MEFFIEAKNSVHVVRFEGNMDVHGIHKIEKSFLESITKIASGKIIIDLSHVDFISSAGLRVLVATLKKIQECGGSLALVGLKPAVQKVFDIVDMNSMFTILKTLDEAIS